MALGAKLLAHFRRTPGPEVVRKPGETPGRFACRRRVLEGCTPSEVAPSGRELHGPGWVLGVGCLHVAHRLPGCPVGRIRSRGGETSGLNLEPRQVLAKPLSARKSPVQRSAAHPKLGMRGGPPFSTGQGELLRPAGSVEPSRVGHGALSGEHPVGLPLVGYSSCRKIAKGVTP
jgi:hypothetical protein